MAEPKFFKTQPDLHKWFVKNHSKLPELIIGFYKVGSGRKSITYAEALDEALSFGWIDGIRRRIDDESYSIRYTPRRAGSIWSAVNIKRANELVKLGLMQQSGLKAFEKREDKKSKIYAYENKDKKLTSEQEKIFRRNKKAWTFFSEQAPWYQRTASYWVINAKQEETQARRLKTLIEDSENGRIIKHLIRTNSK